MDTILISDHFITRFNQRYLNKKYQWNIFDLKSYMKKIFRPYQLDHLERRKNFIDPQYIHFGSSHYLVVRNNKIITIYNRLKK
jgi:hypothetical protein